MDFTPDRHTPIYVWRWRRLMPERYGQACYLLVRGSQMNSCMLQFIADGVRVITSRNGIRRLL
jgi:hypothetical protein